jgi:hypothetical protein
MIIETLNAITQAHAALAHLGAHPPAFAQASTTTTTGTAAGTGYGSNPTGFTNTPSSVSGLVGGVTASVKTATDAAPPVFFGAGAALAGFHAIGKAATKDPQKIQHHAQGVHNGIIGALVGLGGGSIITIIAHIL